MIDIAGQKFTRLTVLSRAGRTKRRHTTWLCRCDCGQEKIIDGSSLRRGLIKSCGCLSRDVARDLGRKRTGILNPSWKHGLCHHDNGEVTSEYRAWNGMHHRCYDIEGKGYRNYGGRGIQVCVRWHKSNHLAFINFLMDMDPKPSRRHSIDRINNDSHYMPSNCRWATPKEQSANRRRRSRKR